MQGEYSRYNRLESKTSETRSVCRQGNYTFLGSPSFPLPRSAFATFTSGGLGSSSPPLGTLTRGDVLAEPSMPQTVP
jgi:hypothetical protein